jgi:hypothetical protein
VEIEHHRQGRGRLADRLAHQAGQVDNVHGDVLGGDFVDQPFTERIRVRR